LLMLLFLQLYLAHLIGDFLLQPDRIAKNKLKAWALAAHAGIHVALACVMVNIGLSRRVVVAVVILAAVHALFDYAKARLSKDTWLAFTLDQAGHLLAVAVASVWLTAASWGDAVSVLRAIAETKPLYLYLCAYVAVVFGGGSSYRGSRSRSWKGSATAWRPSSRGFRTPGSTSVGWSAS